MQRTFFKFSFCFAVTLLLARAGYSQAAPTHNLSRLDQSHDAPLSIRALKDNPHQVRSLLRKVKDAFRPCCPNISSGNRSYRSSGSSSPVRTPASSPVFSTPPHHTPGDSSSFFRTSSSSGSGSSNSGSSPSQQTTPHSSQFQNGVLKIQEPAKKAHATGKGKAPASPSSSSSSGVPSPTWPSGAGTSGTRKFNKLHTFQSVSMLMLIGFDLPGRDVTSSEPITHRGFVKTVKSAISGCCSAGSKAQGGSQGSTPRPSRTGSPLPSPHPLQAGVTQPSPHPVSGASSHHSYMEITTSSGTSPARTSPPASHHSGMSLSTSGKPTPASTPSTPLHFSSYHIFEPSPHSSSEPSLPKSASSSPRPLRIGGSASSSRPAQMGAKGKGTASPHSSASSNSPGWHPHADAGPSGSMNHLRRNLQDSVEFASLTQKLRDEKHKRDLTAIGVRGLVR
ncbi:unnamed protein product [Sympodiomycopsis kandeliae]